ncbi:fungal-specific transcription factor domain-containing protein [Rhizoctonia solani]|nr:fungal-specific transcription factor domain-containing protein [Rhizoctonia solani]
MLTIRGSIQLKKTSAEVATSDIQSAHGPGFKSPYHLQIAQYLEARVKEVEKHLKRLFPGINTKRELDTLLEPQLLPTNNQPNAATADQERTHSPSTRISSLPRKVPPSSTILGGTPATARLIQQVRLANLSSDHVRVDKNDEDIVWNHPGRREIFRYHGLSSLEVLSRDAGVLRNGHNPSSLLSTVPATHRRPEFWQLLPAEIRYINSCPWDSEKGLALDLPPEDLIPVLVDTFFETMFFPVIHRGKFEKQLKDGLHKRDGTFLRILLLVCANGARWCDDPRVLDERWPVPLSAGHRWFRQLAPWQKSSLEQINLQDAQFITLLALYCFGTSGNYQAWITVGIGIRLMQDVGVHRRKSTQSLEDELFKRCFWTMIMLDRLQCLTMDRHPAAQDLDSDLDYALEVDDELWSVEPGAPPPVQPTGVPSRLCCFNQMIKLTRIAGRCLQTVYSLELTKRQIGLEGPQGAAWMFNEINSQFNQWVRDVPSFLRLPSVDDYKTTRFFTDAVEMWGLYYDLLIAANRPFIAKSSSPLAAPALKICCDGAQECAKIFRAYLNTPGSTLSPGMMHPAFESAMVLVIDLIAQGSSTDSSLTDQKEEHLQECMKVLKQSEKKFHIAGRLYDMVREFEEYWRLELSPRVRSGAASSPASGDGSSQRSAQRLPFDPADSVLPKIKVKVEDDTTFDLMLPPPDTTPLIQTSPPISDPSQFAECAPSYDYAHPNAYADEMFTGLYPFNTSHPPAVPASSSSQTQSEAPIPPIPVGPRVGNLQPYLPEYGYKSSSAVEQHAQRSVPVSSPLSDRVPGADLNVASAAIPGLGVFSPRGWMNNSSQVGWTSEPQRSRESLGGTGSSATQWDATMYGTLGLHRRAYHPQARPRPR